MEEKKMKVLTGTHRGAEKRDVISVLEIFDIVSGERTVVREFDHLIEAPNWRKSAEELVYNSEGTIWRLDLTTGEERQIASGYCCECNNDHVLSPDDTKVAVSHQTYEDGESRIYILPIEGGMPQLITPMAPSYLHGWSTDGSTLAYCAERNGEYDIYTIPVTGGVETRLTDAPGLNDGPEYAPDGKTIWFNSVRTGLMQIWKMDADGKNQVQVTKTERNNWFAHVSPDGTHVIYISYAKGDVKPGDHPANKQVEIHKMNSDGSQDEVLVELFGGQGTLNVNSWAPDSRRFAFVSYRLK